MMENPNPHPATQLSERLVKFGLVFRLLGILGAIASVILGIQAGKLGPFTLLERDMETTWHFTSGVFIWWGVAFGLLVQSFWYAVLSDAVALLLDKAAA